MVVSTMKDERKSGTYRVGEGGDIWVESEEENQIREKNLAGGKSKCKSLELCTADTTVA